MKNHHPSPLVTRHTAFTAFGAALLAALALFTMALPAPAQTGWGYALSFDGVNDYVQSQQDVDLANRSFSVEAWAQRRSSDTIDMVVSQGSGGYNRCLMFGFHRYAGNQFLFDFYGNGVGSGNSEIDNAWHHWAGTYDASTRARCLYRDGVLLASDVAPAHYQGSGPLKVGVGPGGEAPNEFDGTIDEVRVWSVARSAADIRANMLRPLTGTEPGLLVHWKFDEAAGSIAYDATPNHFNGILNNGPAWVMATQTNAILPRLKAVRQGENVALRWVGGPGIRLQKSGCLCGPTPTWQEVPGTDTNCSLLLPPAQAAEFFRLVDANEDTDDDLLTRGEEEAGWFIYVDYSGYGESRLVELDVTSDPELADTDGDGLTDFEEWIFGTNPRATDTDHDGLSDYDEIFRWHTSPTSVDTDGDARGPGYNLPPKAQLFDGNELRVLHTSPTLEDTDGDGRTDYEEYDQVGRNPLVAEVPKLGVELVDAVDIRLDVEYAEEAGTSHEYGGELSISDSTRNMYSTSSSLNWGVTVGAEVELGLSPSASVSTEVSVGGEESVGFETETSKTVERSQSDYLTDSRTRTETTASGSMSGGIRLINSGPVTYTITDLGMTVRYLQPGAGAGAKPSFQTLATLIPTLGANGFTLAPGDSTPVLQVEANGLNASRVKQFMARPNSLYLEPAFYELENAQGLNFDFIEEVTRWRTARVQIDYGDGRSEEYRVASNVERNEDGSYAGVTLGNVLSNILHVPFQTTNAQALVPTNTTNERVLYSVRDVKTASRTNGFWAVVWFGEGTAQLHADFEDTALQAGDQVLLVFVRDEDGDGLFSAEEQHYRTDAVGAGDSDRDGLSDAFEVRTGWNVIVTGHPTYHVYSDPAQADQDGDGLTDALEYQKGTDPNGP